MKNIFIIITSILLGISSSYGNVLPRKFFDNDRNPRVKFNGKGVAGTYEAVMNCGASLKLVHQAVTPQGAFDQIVRFLPQVKRILTFDTRLEKSLPVFTSGGPFLMFTPQAVFGSIVPGVNTPVHNPNTQRDSHVVRFLGANSRDLNRGNINLQWSKKVKLPLLKKHKLRESPDEVVIRQFSLKNSYLTESLGGEVVFLTNLGRIFIVSLKETSPKLKILQLNDVPNYKQLSFALGLFKDALIYPNESNSEVLIVSSTLMKQVEFGFTPRGYLNFPPNPPDAYYALRINFSGKIPTVTLTYDSEEEIRKIAPQHPFGGGIHNEVSSFNPHQLTSSTVDGGQHLRLSIKDRPHQSQTKSQDLEILHTVVSSNSRTLPPDVHSSIALQTNANTPLTTAAPFFNRGEPWFFAGFENATGSTLSGPIHRWASWIQDFAGDNHFLKPSWSRLDELQKEIEKRFPTDRSRRESIRQSEWTVPFTVNGQPFVSILTYNTKEATRQPYRWERGRWVMVEDVRTIKTSDKILTSPFKNGMIYIIDPVSRRTIAEWGAHDRYSLDQRSSSYLPYHAALSHLPHLIWLWESMTLENQE